VEIVLKLPGDGRRFAHTVTRAFYRLPNGLGMAAGDGSNLVEREALDAVKKKGFAVGAVDAAESGLNEANHLIGICSLFRTLNAAIGDDTFARPGLIGLVELEGGFVGGFDVLAATAVFEVHGGFELMETRGHFIDRFEGEALEPRLEGKLFRTILIAKSAGDDFVDDLGWGETIVGLFFFGLAEIKFAIDEALEAGEIGVNIGADVIGGDGGRLHGGEGLLEGDAGLGSALGLATPATPAMAGAQDFLVAGDLLEEVVEGGLDGGGWAGGLFLRRELAGRKAQIKRDLDAFARRILLKKDFEVNQFWPEDLKTLPDFFRLVGDFFFDVGSFLDLVTNVNVHYRSLERGRRFP
jgi:hypothetical protein